MCAPCELGRWSAAGAEVRRCFVTFIKIEEAFDMRIGMASNVASCLGFLIVVIVYPLYICHLFTMVWLV